MRKEISTAVYWGAATIGTFGITYAAYDMFDEAFVEPRIEKLQRGEAVLQDCIADIRARGIEPGVVSRIPDACSAFTPEWAETEHSLTGVTSVVGYLIPPYEVLENELDAIQDKQKSAEKAAWPIAAAVGGVSLFAAYGIKQNFEEFY